MSRSSDLSKINQNISGILKAYKTIAVVGISNKPDRPSHEVASYLIRSGYQIFPVNPRYQQVLGLNCFSSLASIPERIEIVNIFRKSEEILPIVGEAIQIGAKVLWIQLGIINYQAAEMALDSGLQVVMDRCIKVEHSALNF